MTLPAGVTVDHARAELRGPREALREVDAVDLAPPLLAAGVRAAQAPVVRFRVTGLAEPVDALADEHAAALILSLGGGQIALRACTPSGLLGLLVRAVGLQPRPRFAAAALTLPAARVADMLATRSAAGAGLDEAAEQLLQEHLDALAAHWRIEAHGTDRWYLEVLDSESGLWTVETAPDRRLTLTPTNATAVLDELAALPGHAGLGPKPASG
jgi:hypothetical protein